jgi:hypothetical protein
VGETVAQRYVQLQTFALPVLNRWVLLTGMELWLRIVFSCGLRYCQCWTFESYWQWMELWLITVFSDGLWYCQCWTFESYWQWIELWLRIVFSGGLRYCQCCTFESYWQWIELWLRIVSSGGLRYYQCWIFESYRQWMELWLIIVFSDGLPMLNLFVALPVDAIVAQDRVHRQTFIFLILSEPLNPTTIKRNCVLPVLLLVLHIAFCY